MILLYSRRQGGIGEKHLKRIPDLRFSSSACTRDAALDKTSNGVSIPGWSPEGKKERKKEFKWNSKDFFRILAVNH